MLSNFSTNKNNNEDNNENISDNNNPQILNNINSIDLNNREVPLYSTYKQNVLDDEPVSYNDNSNIFNNDINDLNLNNDLNDLNLNNDLNDLNLNNDLNDLNLNNDINDLNLNNDFNDLNLNNDFNDINFNFNDDLQINFNNNDYIVTNKSGKKLGSFSVNDIINNFVSLLKPQLNNNNITTRNNNVVNNLIGNISVDDDIIKFNLKNYKNSIFMKNLELLMYMNHKLHQLQRTGLTSQLNGYSFNLADTVLIKGIIDRFIHNIILKTLELILVLCNKIKNINENKGLKKVLNQYTDGLTFRLSQYINNSLENITKKIRNIEDSKKQSDNLKEMIGGKMDNLLVKLDRQNKILYKYYKIIKRIKKKK